MCFQLDLKPQKNGKAFYNQGKSGNFEQTRKVKKKHTKYWKGQGISDKCYLSFIVMFKLTVYCNLKWIKFSVRKKNKNIKKMIQKWKKNTGKAGNFVTP